MTTAIQYVDLEGEGAVKVVFRYNGQEVAAATLLDSVNTDGKPVRALTFEAGPHVHGSYVEGEGEGWFLRELEAPVRRPLCA